MRLISKTEVAPDFGEKLSIVYVYEFENKDEFWEIDDCTDRGTALEEFFEVQDEHPVVMGVQYKTYDYHYTTTMAILIENIQYNV